MKMTKLLTGAAIAALLTGAANAQVVTELRIDDNVSGSTTTTGAILASEYDASNAGNQNFEFTIVPRNAANNADLDAGFAAYAGTSVDIVVTVSGGVFPTALLKANYPDTGTAGVCNPSLVSGGAAGDSTATFRVGDLSNCDDDGTTAGFGDADADEAALGFDLPIDLTSTTANVSYTMTTTAIGANVSSAVYARTTPVDPVLVAGTQALTSLFIGTPGFATTVTGSDRTAVLSTTGTSYNALNNSTIATLAFTNESAGGGALVSVGGAAANWNVGGQVDDIEVIVTLDDPSGFASVTLDGTGTNDTTVALVNGVATFQLDDNASTGLDTTEVSSGVNVVLNADADATTLINEGNFTVAVSSEAASGTNLTIGGGSDTESITRQGDSSATFEWVGDSTASTQNFFRITGLDTTTPPAISFFVENAASDSALNTEYALGAYTPSAGGELIITSGQIAGIIGSDFGRADIRFFVEGDIDEIRRFHVTDGVITLGNDS